MFVAPPHVSFQYPQTSELLSQRLRHKRITRLKPAGVGHSRASLLNFIPATDHSEGHKDLQLQQTDFNWWWGISVALFLKAARHAEMLHQSETQWSSWLADPPQAVVTNDHLQAAQFKGSGTRCLLKLVKRAEANKARERETGPKVKPECYNYSCETGPGCLVQGRRCFSSAV